MAEESRAIEDEQHSGPEGGQSGGDLECMTSSAAQETC